MPFAAALLFVTGIAPAGQEQGVAAAREALAGRCGIARERVVRDSDSVEVVEILGSAPLDDEALRCAGGAIAAAGVGISFEHEPLRRRYALLVARDGLAARGLLARLPVFDRAHDTPAAFALRLERLCGARPHALLVAEGESIRLKPGLITSTPDSRFGRVICAVDAATAAGFEPLGLPPPPIPVVVPTTPVS